MKHETKKNKTQKMIADVAEKGRSNLQQLKASSWSKNINIAEKKKVKHPL